MHFETADHSVATLRRRRHLSRSWAVLVIGWAVLRTLIVWAAVGDYGLNPWVYLGIDVVSASVDAYSTPKMVLSFIDEHYARACRWGLISLGVFLVPDAYIFLGTRSLPGHLVAFILCIISVTLLAAAVGIVRKVRAGRAERAIASLHHPAVGASLV